MWLLVCLVAAGPARSVEVPVADFCRQFEFDNVKISPGGTYLATMINHGEETALAFIRLDDLKSLLALKASARETFFDFFWVNDERVVVMLAQKIGSLEQPVSYGEIYSVNVDGTKKKLVFGYRTGEMQTGTNIRKAESIRAWGELVDPLLNDPRHVLVMGTPMTRGKEAVPSVYRVDIYSGLKDEMAHGPLPLTEYVTDESGEVRMAIGTDEQNKIKVFYRDGRGSAWKDAAQVKGFTADTIPEGFLSDRRSLYVIEPDDRGVRGLYLVNVDDGERTKIFQSELVDPSGVVRDPVSGRIVAVESEPDFPRYDHLEPDHLISRSLQALTSTFKGQHVRLTSQTSDGKKAIALVYGDRQPGFYCLIDTGSMEVKALLSRMSWIKPEQMSEVTPFRIKATDGLVVSGFVTLPVTSEEAKNLPLVVMPHGGPHGVRDWWNFNPAVQLLANRGFAVLQVNFRGSSGYGVAFEKAGYRQWGGRVQQDIYEATRWLIGQRIADPKRVCIFGASFGGYSALMSVILYPETYRCAAGYAGAYDLELLSDKGEIRTASRGRSYLADVIGTEKEFLRQNSPVANAGKIKVPVLLVHGGEDRRVPIEHAYRLKRSLEENGASVETLFKPTEAHGFYDEVNLEEFYTRLVSFLRQHTKQEG